MQQEPKSSIPEIATGSNSNIESFVTDKIIPDLKNKDHRVLAAFYKQRVDQLIMTCDPERRFVLSRSSANRQQNTSNAFLCILFLAQKKNVVLNDDIVRQMMYACLDHAPSRATIPDSLKPFFSEAKRLFDQLEAHCSIVPKLYRRKTHADLPSEGGLLLLDRVAILESLSNVDTKVSDPGAKMLLDQSAESFGKEGDAYAQKNIEREDALLRQTQLFPLLTEFMPSMKDHEIRLALLSYVTICEKLRRAPSAATARHILMYLRGNGAIPLDAKDRQLFKDTQEVFNKTSSFFQENLPSTWPRNDRGVARSSLLPRIDIVRYFSGLSSVGALQSSNTERDIAATVARALDRFNADKHFADENVAEENGLFSKYGSDFSRTVTKIAKQRSDADARRLAIATIVVFQGANEFPESEDLIALDVYCYNHDVSACGTRKLLFDQVQYVVDRIRQVEQNLPSAWPKKRVNDKNVIRSSLIPRLGLAKVLTRNSAIESPIPAKIESFRDVLRVVEENPRIKAVSFDFMDTLVEWNKGAQERHRQLYTFASKAFSRFGVNVTANEFRDVRTGKKRDGVWYRLKDEYGKNGRDFKAIEAFRIIVKDLCDQKKTSLSDKDREKLARELEQGQYDVERSSAVLVPHVLGVLSALRKRGIKVGVYSNTPFQKAHVVKTFDELGILQLIGPGNVFASSETGFQKDARHSGAYQILQQHFGFSPDEILHVGDQFKADYLGARRAGFHATEFHNPVALKRLEKLHPATMEYRQEQYGIFAGRLTLLARDSMESHIDTRRLTPLVASAAMRAYEIGRDIFGPVALHFSESVLDDLQKNPKKLCLCIGRDGISEFILMKRLLKLMPQRWNNVNTKNIQYCNFSRRVRDKVLADSGVEFQPGYEGREDKRMVASGASRGYRKKLDDYLRSLGFHDAPEVMLVDSGLQGSTQTGIEVIYPKKKITGRYLYNYRRYEDPARDHKSGYLLEKEALAPENHEMIYHHGDKIYEKQSVIYLFEDMFNGTFSSNNFLDTVNDPGRNPALVNARRPIGPRIHKMTPIEGAVVDPDLIPPDFRNADVYRLCKLMVLRGVLDAARLRVRQLELDPDGKRGILQPDPISRQNLASYAREFREYRDKGKIISSSSPASSSSALESSPIASPRFSELDALLVNFLVRKVGYEGKDKATGRPREDIYREKWGRYLQS